MATFQGNDELDFKDEDFNDDSSLGASSENSLANLQIIRNHVDTFILSMLSKNDCYGYEIMKEIDNRTHGKYNLKQPTLYSCLKRLEKKGDISSYWGTISNGARRRYYSLTKQGREFLESELQCWEFERTIGDKLLSDKLIDLETYTVPFTEKDLKPKTKREKSPKYSDFDTNISEDKNLASVSNSNTSNYDTDAGKIFTDSYSVRNNDDKEISAIEKYAYDDSVQNFDNLKDYLYKKSHNEEINNKYFENENAEDSSENLKYDENSSKYSDNSIENEYSENSIGNEYSNSYENYSDSANNISSQEEFYESRSESMAKNNIFTYQDSPEYYKSEEENFDENDAIAHDIVTEPIDENEIYEDNSSNLDKPNTDYVDRFFSDSENEENLEAEEQLRRKQEALRNLYPENYSSLYEDGDYSFSKKNIKKAEDNKTADAYKENKTENYVNEKPVTSEPNYFANQGAIKNKEIQNIAQLSKFYKTNNNKEILENIESAENNDNSELGYTSMSELKMKLYNKGFKLRPYSKENVSSYYSMNFIYANAIRRDTSFIMYAIVFLELLLAYLSFFSLLQLKLWPFIVAAVVFAIIPVYFFIVNHFDPNFRTRAKFDLKISLINSIMAFLCIVAVVVLLGFYVFHATFDDVKTMIMPIFVPIIFALDIPITVLIYSLLYKSKKYHLS